MGLKEEKMLGSVDGYVKIDEFLIKTEEWCLLEDWVGNCGFWSEMGVDSRIKMGGVIEAFGDGSVCMEREVVFQGNMVGLRKSYLRRNMLQDIYIRIN